LNCGTRRTECVTFLRATSIGTKHYAAGDTVDRDSIADELVLKLIADGRVSLVSQSKAELE
jgi:hypothetical protein